MLCTLQLIQFIAIHTLRLKYNVLDSWIPEFMNVGKIRTLTNQ